MKKKIISTTVLLALITLVQAHEFWLQPDKFFFKPGERLVVSFKVGENFMGEPWDLKKHRVEKLELHHLTGVGDLTDSVSEGEKKNLTVTLKEEGTHLVVMQSNNAFIEMEGDQFNKYLKEDGLDDIYAHREKTNMLNKSSKEYYSRHTKLLVQVGDKKDDTYKTIAGFPIEIIPEKNPYTLKKGDLVRFKILFEGEPLFGAKVKIWNRFDNRTTLQNIHTEKDGMMETRISNPGPWMVSVVKMVPSKQPGADWQSYWSSLVFGVE
jgi:uncharacterized GH25 family protein